MFYHLQKLSIVANVVSKRAAHSILVDGNKYEEHHIGMLENYSLDE